MRTHHGRRPQRVEPDAVEKDAGRSRTLLVIEGIPVWSCPHCGESYVTDQTMHEIECIKALRKSVAVARQVPVAMFHLQRAQQPFRSVCLNRCAPVRNAASRVVADPRPR